ncbi:MAG: DNA polymerase III subunit gamma/tau [Rickettsiales bacterium]|jgi:DNA polymerase-3 subunit gamma/tau|nr:DNA polymerase III subunit gamma/tau [Rickettsiales bacterium]
MEKKYEVLARKYRPQTFREMVGQSVFAQTMTNAIEKGKVHHAFILTGIRGVGKTSGARILAKSLNCVGEDGNGKETPNPCLKCFHCQAIAGGNDQDVVEFDAASNTGVDKIRDIIESVNYAPLNSRYKIYIIDEVHMLSGSAFNALLKTLEEPPPYVKFIFATTEIRKVPITILSRCIRFDLERVPRPVLAKHLADIAEKEGYKLDETAAGLIANAGDGSVRDSLSILDRIISFNNYSEIISEETTANILGLGGKEAVYSLYESLTAKDANETLEKFEKIYNSLVNVNNFLNDLLDITHMILMAKNGIPPANLSSFQRTWIEKNKDCLSQAALFRIWQFVIRALDEIKNTNNSRTFLEVLLLKICYGINIPEVGDLIKKIKTGNIGAGAETKNTVATETSGKNIPIPGTKGEKKVEGKKENGEDLAGAVLDMFDGAKIVEENK